MEETEGQENTVFANKLPLEEHTSRSSSVLRAYPNNWYAWLPKAFHGVIRIGS